MSLHTRVMSLSARVKSHGISCMIYVCTRIHMTHVSHTHACEACFYTYQPCHYLHESCLRETRNMPLRSYTCVACRIHLCAMPYVYAHDRDFWAPRNHTHTPRTTDGPPLPTHTNTHTRTHTTIHSLTATNTFYRLVEGMIGLNCA